ncbi:MAG: RNA 2',3'-cyclic phosphodiesterase [Burkholderiaceae bacterium]|jgi:2'-5' RNA ligase|nr:RNA 2',3'-cyclic phosphodiesterase [Burkholderiaceae bacterium]
MNRRRRATSGDARQTLRLFYALWPDSPTCRALSALQGGLSGRVVPAENLHLTLVFLGEQPVSVLPRLKSILMDLSAHAVLIPIDVVGSFPRAKIVWAGSSESAHAILDMRRALLSALKDSGLIFSDTGRFKPHFTLARQSALEGDSLPVPIEGRLNRLVLARSTPATTPAGHPCYTLVAGRVLSAA